MVPPVDYGAGARHSGTWERAAGKRRPKPFEYFSLWGLGEFMKTARACVVAVLRAPMIGTLAGTAAAETGGAGTMASCSLVPGDDNGWGRDPR